MGRASGLLVHELRRIRRVLGQGVRHAFQDFFCGGGKDEVYLAAGVSAGAMVHMRICSICQG